MYVPACTRKHTHARSVYRSLVIHTCAHANTDNIMVREGERSRAHTQECEIETEEREIETEEREISWYRGREW
jgi:hypothetical protein